MQLEYNAEGKLTVWVVDTMWMEDGDQTAAAFATGEGLRAAIWNEMAESAHEVEGLDPNEIYPAYISMSDDVISITVEDTGGNVVYVQTAERVVMQ